LSNISPVYKDGAVLILESLAAGTFIYVTFLEVLAQEKGNEQNSLKQLLAIFIGFAVIAALQLAFGLAQSINGPSFAAITATMAVTYTRYRPNSPQLICRTRSSTVWSEHWMNWSTGAQLTPGPRRHRPVSLRSSLGAQQSHILTIEPLLNAFTNGRHQIVISVCVDDLFMCIVRVSFTLRQGP
ncbi:hypothetical protein ANCDUO_21353, partial [Ancylostoma duodenale]